MKDFFSFYFINMTHSMSPSFSFQMQRIVEFLASLGIALNDLPRQVRIIENEGKPRACWTENLG